MRPFKFFLPVFLFIVGCASKTLTGYEQGELKESRQNVKESASPEELSITFETKKSGSSDLIVVNINNKQEIKEEWIDQYSKIASYETRCRGWRGTNSFLSQNNEYCKLDTLGFTISHLLLIGFIFDMEIPFQEYGSAIKTTELVDGELSIPNSKSYARLTPIKTDSVYLTINKIKQSVQLSDGQAEFDPTKFKIPSNWKISESKASLSFGSQTLDVSNEFNDFARNIVEAEESKKEKLAREKEELERFKFDQICLELKQWPIFYTIVQKMNDHLYEMAGTGYAVGQRAILKTKKAIYDRTGTPAKIRIQRVGTESLPLKNGFSAQYAVWEECKFESERNCMPSHPDFACPRE